MNTKFQRRVLKYVTNKPTNTYHLRNGEHGFSIAQVKKQFRNHAQWRIHELCSTIVVFQSLAVLSRLKEKERQLLTELIERDHVHPNDVYNSTVAKRKMSHCLFWLRKLLSRDLCHVIASHVHFVDWLKTPYIVKVKSDEKIIQHVHNKYSMTNTFLSFDRLQFRHRISSYYYYNQNLPVDTNVIIKFVDLQHFQKASVFYNIPCYPLERWTVHDLHRKWIRRFQSALHNSRKRDKCNDMIRKGFDYQHENLKPHVLKFLLK